MDETQQKLLDRGVVILPETMDYEAYAYVLEATLTRREQIVMYCAGSGGSIRDALAICDLIEMHGDVVGLLVGCAVSAHSVIWAACHQRYVSPSGGIGVHRIASHQIDSFMDVKKSELLAREYQYFESRMVQIYAAAGRRDGYFWKETLNSAGSDWYQWFNARQLIDMGMAWAMQAFTHLAKRDESVIASAVEQGRAVAIAPDGTDVWAEDKDG